MIAIIDHSTALIAAHTLRPAVDAAVVVDCAAVPLLPV